MSVNESLETIEMLKGQIRELEKKRDDTIKSINEPIYKAKAEAESILNEAKNIASARIKSADTKKYEVEEALKIKVESAEKTIKVAEERLRESAIAKKKLDEEVQEFNSIKFANEANIKEQKTSADVTMAKAIDLSNAQDKRKIALDSRESMINQKQANLDSTLEKLNKVKEVTDRKIEELKAIEKAHTDDKEEVLSVKAGTQKMLGEINRERGSLVKLKEETLKLADAVKLEKEKVEVLNKENASKLNAIGDAIQKSKDEQATLKERERMNKLLGRQVEEKIARLKELREEEKTNAKQKSK